MGRMGKNKLETKLIKLGSNPELHHGSLSDPVYKTSTIIFNDYKSFIRAKKNKFKLPYYGRFGNYTSKRFEETVAKLYESEASIATSSGLSAITISLLSFLRNGDELIVSENCYEPVFNFCEKELNKFGIKTIFFRNNNLHKLKNLISNKTKIIYLESPGSLNFQVENIEEIVKIAKQKKIKTIIDNTWATFLGSNPLKWGVDIVIESCTKYFSGHSDNFCGVIACDRSDYKKIKQTAVRLGDFVSTESCSLALRGLRTLDIRLNRHEENAKQIFKYLKKKKIVHKILFLPDRSNPNHKMWKKYFTRSNGLISFAMKKTKKIEFFIDNLELFKIGFSWGGFESLILPINQIKPTAKKLDDHFFWFRIHIGLESPLDMINDLENGFKSYEEK